MNDTNCINNDTILQLNKFIESIIEQHTINNITLKFKQITEIALADLQDIEKINTNKNLLAVGLNKSKKYGYTYIAIINLKTLELTIYSLAGNLDIEYDTIDEELNSIITEVNFENLSMDILLSNSRIPAAGLTQQIRFKELFKNVKIMKFKENNFHTAVYFTDMFSYLKNIEEVYMIDCDFNDLGSTMRWFRESSVRKVIIKDCNMPNLESTYLMFVGCHKLEEVDISSLEQSTKLNNISYMFNGCYKLKSIKGLENLKTKQISSIDYAFTKCGELEKINFSNVDFKNLKKAEGAFRGCSKLKELHIENFGRSTRITGIADMLKDTPTDINVYLDKPIEIKATNSYILTSSLNEISPLKKYIKVTTPEITEDLLSYITTNLVSISELSNNRQMLSDNQIINYNSALSFDTITIRKLSEVDKERLVSKLKLLQEPFYDMAGYMVTWTQDSLNLAVDELKLNKQSLMFFNEIEYHPELKEVVLHPKIR